MYAARIKMGWVDQVFEGDSAHEIMEKVEEYQDFGCLLMMGRANEGKKGQKELDKLQKFLDKYYDYTLTMEDIKNLDVKISLGAIKCTGIAESEEEIGKLKDS